MRFINTASLEMRNFAIDDAPPYAVLSYIWGDEEMSFHELQEMREGKYESQEGRERKRQGYDKIRQFCKAAQRAGIAWAWLDSCCINQIDAVEKEEAARAFSSLYSKAMVCYVLLWDIAAGHNDVATSRWFERVWIWQETLLTKEVVFYDRKWKPIGHICTHGSDCPMQILSPSLHEQISQATGISLAYLRGEKPMQSTDNIDEIGWLINHPHDIPWLINHPQATMVDVFKVMTRNRRNELADNDSQQPEELENSIDDLDRNADGYIIEELESDQEVESEAESVFSVPSYATSLSSIASLVDGEEIRAMIQTLFHNAEVIELPVSAMKSSLMSQARLSRNLRRLIVAFGNNLSGEANGRDQTRVARLFASNRRAARVASDCIEHASKLALSSSSSDEPRDQLVIRTHEFDSDNEGYPSTTSELSESGDGVESSNIAELKRFCMTSVAYAEFRARLLEFVHQPYKRKIDGVLEANLTKRATGGTYGSVEQIKDELCWVPPELIFYKSTDSFTMVDRAKELVELWMNETWLWWPLRQRRHRLPSGRVRVGWTCVSSLRESLYSV